jgi:alpha-tubulin suppressor-like RCC1 family protein
LANVPTGAGFTNVACGNDHSVALKNDGTVKIEDCIRSNTFNTKWDRLLDTVHFVKKTWLDQ